MACVCSIIPADVLKKLAKDKDLTKEVRDRLLNTAKIDAQIRKVRMESSKLTALAAIHLPIPPKFPPLKPAVVVYNCNNTSNLPGAMVTNPGSSADKPIKNAFTTTQAVADFYKKVFGRSSVDNTGMTLNSSVHYGVHYNNAFWNGQRMVYGDGDGDIFIDFTASDDVIAHELTHGVTQYTAQFAYQNEPGGLNESASDVFGTMLRQWRANQTVNQADWLIGHDIMGPGAIKRGFTCLRDMANPGAAHCLAPQPSKYADYQPGMDPHYSSGIPNYAFYKIAMAVGGKSWEKTGQVWYQALTGHGPSPNMTMKQFSELTRNVAKTMYPADRGLQKAFNDGWVAVGL